MIANDRTYYLLTLCSALTHAVMEGRRASAAFSRHMATCTGRGPVETVVKHVDPIQVLSLKQEIMRLNARICELEVDNNRLYANFAGVVRAGRDIRESSDTTVYDWLSHEEEINMLRAEIGQFDHTTRVLVNNIPNVKYTQYLRYITIQSLLGGGDDTSLLRGRLKSAVTNRLKYAAASARMSSLRRASRS